MIAKEWDEPAERSAMLKAGQDAEKQMAFYLKREFSKDKDIFVFNGVRLVHKGEVAQIDHLILHKYGFVLIESKSISGTVEINEYGEWIRWVKNNPQGMRSPIIQLKMQFDILHDVLTENAEQMLGKLLGMQTFFGGRKYDLIAAVSDKTRIERKQHIPDVYKADAVAGEVRKRINDYKKKVLTGGAVWFNKRELEKIVAFILASHCDKKVNERKKTRVTEKKPTSDTNLTKKPNIKPKAISNVKKSLSGLPPFICDRCEQPFEIRYKHSFYLYCPGCRRRPLPLDPKCIKCGGEAVLKRELGTRIIQYKCLTDSTHQGIFHKNKELYVKDEK